MISVLVIDDEPIICELIRMLADWEGLDLKLIGIENNGVNAYHTIVEKKPDIVITDIRIPGIDGLELIRRLQKNELPVQFIVISGYRQFEYAHSALQFGVTDYLLKPINKEELNRALKRTADRIRLERQDRQEMDHLRQEVLTQGEQLRQQFVSKLIAGQIPDEDCTVEAINGKYGYEFRNTACGIFILKASSRKKETRMLIPIYFSRVIPILQDVFSDAETFVFSEKGSRLYCLYQFGKPEEGRGKWQLLSERFQEISSMFEDIMLTICPAPAAENPSHLQECMREAEHSVSLRLNARHSGVVNYEEVFDYHVLRVRDVLSSEQTTSLREAVVNCVRNEIDSIIRKIFRPLEENGVYWKYDPSVLFSLCSEIIRILLSVNACRQEIADQFHEVMEEIDHAETVNDLIYRFRKQLLSSMTPYFQVVEERSRMPVQVARNYIREHFAEQIDLERVALEADISPNYLSTLFKRETGLGFSEYLTQVRITEAKKLLRTTRLSVTEVAERTGYMDSKYFTKVFSKECGISPKKYQKL